VPVTGFDGGLLIWTFVNGLILSTLCLLLSLATRHFLKGPTLVLVTMSLALLLTLTGAAVGMAKSDFTLQVVFPYVLLATALAAAWILWMKAHLRIG